jgi:hypothetical protein
MTWWLRLYPKRWRERYAEEFTALIQDRGWSLATGYDVLRSMLDAWLHPDLVEASGALQPAMAPRARGGRFDKFTPRSRTALGLAHRAAIRLRSAQIGPEHLLLGLLEDGDSVATHVLVQHGIELADLRAALLARLQPPVGTEHLLLGLVAQAEGVAVQSQ